ncbi:hypothetical protein BDB01DRAFT_732834, partial [Pilobolus umbonatus]
WKTSTCLNYKSLILAIYNPPTQERISQDHHFKQFFHCLRSTTIIPMTHPSYDLTPILSRLSSWGSNDTISAFILTRKLCFLLAITGFLRPSDIHRIDMSSSTANTDLSLLTLIIDCPKEKRRGSPIRKQVVIRAHTDPLLCPVLTFTTYIQRIACSPCFHPHPTRPSRSISTLVRSLSDFNSAVGPQTIGRHINSLIDIIAVQHSTSRRPRARALGSTNAVSLGASLEDVLTHGSWASAAVFDQYYRLSRVTATDFTSLSLGHPSNSGTLDSKLC